MNITTTFNNEGKAMTETAEGIEMPADYSFATVNDYVHTPRRQYEELEALCLAMASEIDRLNAKRIAPEARWYCVSNEGLATLCASEMDAIDVAGHCSFAFPNGAPYKAVRLMEILA